MKKRAHPLSEGPRRNDVSDGSSGLSDRDASVIEDREEAVAAIRLCSLSDYRECVGRFPRPSDAQIENFVQFVSGAHSWYKHLPLLPPGQPFRFFVDPFSGYDRVVQPGGSVIHQERTEATPRFHYTWMTTEEYRRRFAYLAYESGAGTHFYVELDDVVREYADLPIIYTADGACHIPIEVAEAGLVELTSLIYPEVTTTAPWGIMLALHSKRVSTGTSEQWPSETGGEETLHQIKQVYDRARESGQSWLEEDEDLVRLVLPEQRRLRTNMTGAINRMLALLYDEGESDRTD